MLLHQRNNDAVIGDGSLQLAIEIDAEAFPERQPPSAVDAVPPRRVNNQLHSTRFVEEAFCNDLGLSGNTSQNRSGFFNIVHNLFSDAVRNTSFFCEPALRLVGFHKSLVHFASKLGYRRGKLPGTSRRFAEPKRDAWRQSLSVLDPDFAGADTPDTPRPIAQKKDISRQTLDCEILIHFADKNLIGKLNDIVVSGVRNSTAIRDCA